MATFFGGVIIMEEGLTVKWEMAPQNGINRRAGFAVSGTISCTGIGSSGGRGGASFFLFEVVV